MEITKIGSYGLGIHLACHAWEARQAGGRAIVRGSNDGCAREAGMPYGMVDTQSDEGKEKNNTVNKKDGITMRHNASGGGGLGGVACRPVARGGAGGSRLAPRGRRATVCGARRRGLRCPWRRAAGHGHLDEPHAGGQLPEHEAPHVRLIPPASGGILQHRQPHPPRRVHAPDRAGAALPEPGAPRRRPELLDDVLRRGRHLHGRTAPRHSLSRAQTRWSSMRVRARTGEVLTLRGRRGRRGTGERGQASTERRTRRSAAAAREPSPAPDRRRAQRRSAAWRPGRRRAAASSSPPPGSSASGSSAARDLIGVSLLCLLPAQQMPPSLSLQAGRRLLCQAAGES
jgi:hypothetical protein